MAGTDKLWQALRSIAARPHICQTASVDPWDAEELCYFGLAIDLGHGRYCVTPAGEDVLRKGEEQRGSDEGDRQLAYGA